MIPIILSVKSPSLGHAFGTVFRQFSYEWVLLPHINNLFFIEICYFVRFRRFTIFQASSTGLKSDELPDHTNT